MPEARPLEKAKLVEITLGDVDNDSTVVGEPMDVQFNPETLKLAYSNSVGKTDVTGTAAMQYIATSATKLDLELWFDATVDESATDVREMSAGVHYFLTPKQAPQRGDAKFTIPAVRFSWGTFLFEGVVTSLNETLELFSHDGRALRSSLSLSLSSQDILFKIQTLDSAKGSGPGQTPMTAVPEGGSFQQVASGAGAANGWQALAALNDIDNPRLATPGLSVSLDVSIGGR